MAIFLTWYRTFLEKFPLVKYCFGNQHGNVDMSLKSPSFTTTTVKRSFEVYYLTADQCDLSVIELSVCRFSVQVV